MDQYEVQTHVSIEWSLASCYRHKIYIICDLSTSPLQMKTYPKKYASGNTVKVLFHNPPLPGLPDHALPREEYYSGNRNKPCH